MAAERVRMDYSNARTQTSMVFVGFDTVQSCERNLWRTNSHAVMEKPRRAEEQIIIMIHVLITCKRITQMLNVFSIQPAESVPSVWAPNDAWNSPSLAPPTAPQACPQK